MELGLVAVWWVLYVGLGLLALPAASLVFAHLTDRGAGLSIPLAFGTLGVAAYWIGQLRFGHSAALGALGVLAILSGISLYRGVDLSLRRYRDVVVVFTLAYLFLLVFRAFKPGVWPGGGEKFLDFGLLASLLRSPALPPEDVWFANEPVQYYYGGHMLSAVFALLTDTPARYAYNTAIAGFYAAYVAAAWGLAGAIAEGLGKPYRVAGGFAAFFVAIASNLSSPLRLLVWLLPVPAGQRLAELVSLEIRGLATGSEHFNYWFASRIIDWKTLGGDQWHLINEFPFFAFLNGDLHAHMMSPVLLLLGTGLAYSYWRTPAEAVLRRRLLIFVSIPPVAGLIVVVNTWSFPAIVGIAWLALLFAPAPPWELLPRRLSDRLSTGVMDSWQREEGARITIATMYAAIIAGVAVIVALPFLLGVASGRGLGFLPEPRSDLPGLLVVHGAFLGIALAYIARRTDRTEWMPVAVGFGALLLVTWLFQAPAVALFGPLLVVAWYLLRTRDDVDFEIVLLVGVLGLLLLVEFVFVMEEAGPGRSNTVFKVYTQVWALWSVSAGTMASWFYVPGRAVPAIRRFGGRIHERVSRAGGSTDEHSAPSHWRQQPEGTTTSDGDGSVLGTLLLVGLVLSLSIYAGFSLVWTIETGRDSPSLDSHAYIEERHPEEARAIEWLGDLEGQPTMVSAPGTKIYRWVNGPSSMTGIPTVAGWAHEIGYRGETPYRNRVHDVGILYRTTEPESRAVLLDLYDVEYIYVGPIEKERYGTQDYAAEPGISVAYEDEHVTIYHVDQTAIAS